MLFCCFLRFKTKLKMNRLLLSTYWQLYVAFREFVLQTGKKKYSKGNLYSSETSYKCWTVKNNKKMLHVRWVFKGYILLFVFNTYFKIKKKGNKEMELALIGSICEAASDWSTC